MGEVAIPRKSVVGEEVNGRSDVGKLWCGFAKDTRGMYSRAVDVLQINRTSEIAFELYR